MVKRKRYRPDKDGKFQGAFERAKKMILATQDVCGICGKPVDKNLKYPHPASPCIDHIIPIAKGGHPADLDNLQLAHLSCNRWKADRITPAIAPGKAPPQLEINNRDLPQSINWIQYRADGTKTNQDDLEQEAQRLDAQGMALYPDGIRPKIKN